MQASSLEKDMEELAVTPAGLGADAFRHAFRHHPAGVAVVTADAGDGPVALTASSVVSVSAEPPLLVCSISDFSAAGPALNRAGSVVVHLLGAGQVELAKLCARGGADRFADGSAWTRLETGEPLFLNVPSWIRGRVIERVRAGTSTLLIIHALSAGSAGAGAADDRTEPLVYHNRTWHRLGEHSVIAG